MNIEDEIREIFDNSTDRERSILAVAHLFRPYLVKPRVLTVTQYAKLKGITRQAVLSKIKRGILKAEKCPCGQGWLITLPEGE